MSTLYQPLGGVKVLDLGILIPPALTSAKLVALGADVVKVEQPPWGDRIRAIPPYGDDGESPQHMAQNWGKRSIALDLGDEEGRATFLRLADVADVIVENQLAGSWARLGIDFAALRSERPELVVCSITGFGQTGPYATLPSHGLNMDALADTLNLDWIEGEPRLGWTFTSWGNELGSAYAALAIVAAVLSARTTGEGAWIDLSCWDALVESHRTEIAMTNVGGAPFNMHESSTGEMYNAYLTQDGKPFLMAALEQKFWDAFCRGVGREDLVPLRDAEEQIHFGWDDEQLHRELADIFATATADEWDRRFLEWDVPGLEDPRDPRGHGARALRGARDRRGRTGFVAQHHERDPVASHRRTCRLGTRATTRAGRAPRRDHGRVAHAVNLEFGFLARGRPDQPSSRADVERLEALGIDSLWSAGHISNGRAVPEAVVGAALLAGQTERVRIGTAVLLAPLYHPVIVAKQFAELDRATGGRMMLGVGVGGEYPDEFQALQTPVTERGARTDEAIGVLKRLWSGGAVGNDGPTWPFDPISIDPPPVQPGGPPVIVAGRKAPAMRRAAASGDGWMPFLYSPAQYAASVETVRGHAVSIGQRPRRVRLDVLRVRERRRRCGRSAPQGRDVRRWGAGRQRHALRGDDRSCRRRRHPGAGGGEAVRIRRRRGPAFRHHRVRHGRRARGERVMREIVPEVHRADP